MLSRIFWNYVLGILAISSATAELLRKIYDVFLHVFMVPSSKYVCIYMMITILPQTPSHVGSLILLEKKLLQKS